MKKYKESDIQAVKDRVDLRVIVGQDIGKDFGGRKEWLVSSPMRSDMNPSFLVSQNHAYDFAMEQQFDLFDYLKETRGMSFGDVMREYGDSSAWQDRDLEPVEKTYEPFESPLTMREYSRIYGPDRKSGLPYMKSRGFNKSHMAAYRIGYKTIKHRYRFTDGSEYETNCGRIAIPTFIGTDVHAVALRRDPIDVQLRIKTQSKRFEEVREDLAKRMTKKSRGKKTYTAEDIEEEKVIDALWGGRYKYHVGSKNTVFNCGILLNQVDTNKYAGKPFLPMLVIDEGQFNAMAFEAIGVPAIAFKDHRYTDIMKVCENVGAIYVPIHNDPEYETLSGSTFNPGMSYFRKIKRALCEVEGSARVIGLNIPKEYADANDFWLRDQSKFERWVQKSGIQTMKSRTRLSIRT